jgi:pentapeptide MXKDX repeat protein
VIGRGGARRQAPISASLIGCSVRPEQPFAEDTVINASSRGTSESVSRHHSPASTNRDKRKWLVTKPVAASSLGKRQTSLFENQPKDHHPMTTTTRIGLGLSAALVSLGLAFAPATFAQDKMGKGDGMKQESMSKDAMKKEEGVRKDGMKHDGMMKDGMKKDDAMKKN